MLTSKKIQNNWSRIKVEVVQKWGRLTLQELEKTSGSFVLICKLVKEKYGNVGNFYNEFEKICDRCSGEYYKYVNLEEELLNFLKDAA